MKRETGQRENRVQFAALLLELPRCQVQQHAGLLSAAGERDRLLLCQANSCHCLLIAPVCTRINPLVRLFFVVCCHVALGDAAQPVSRSSAAGWKPALILNPVGGAADDFEIHLGLIPLES